MSDNIQIIRHPPIHIGHSAAPREELWAIGDIHGRADLLAALLAEIEATPELPDHLAHRLIVSLGDVIDRGPESLRCIDLLIAADAIGLQGNHEQMICLAASTREERWHREGWFPIWDEAGGGAVLNEVWQGDFERARHVHPALLPTYVGLKRWDWLRTLRPAYRSGDVVLVHAGVDPQQPLEATLYAPWDDTDQVRSPYWIRGRFLHFWGERERDVFVVHGHTPTDNVKRAGDETAGGRLNLDLGSYESGGARAVRIVDDVVTIVDAWGPARSENLRAAFREGRT